MQKNFSDDSQQHQQSSQRHKYLVRNSNILQIFLPHISLFFFSFSPEVQVKEDKKKTCELVS